MKLERHKKLAREFFERFSAHDIAGALDTLTEDVTWLIVGKPETLPAASVYDKEKITRLLRGMDSQLTGGLKMTVKGVIAEGEKVAVEVESYGKLKNGRIYNNTYHFLLVMRDGKITEVREYLDTQHVYAIWFQP